jgi:hypothetical protein
LRCVGHRHDAREGRECLFFGQLNSPSSTVSMSNLASHEWPFDHGGNQQRKWEALPAQRMMTIIGLDSNKWSLVCLSLPLSQARAAESIIVISETAPTSVLMLSVSDHSLSLSLSRFLQTPARQRALTRAARSIAQSVSQSL